jgi:hypothetical protein
MQFLRGLYQKTIAKDDAGNGYYAKVIWEFSYAETSNLIPPFWA